MNHAEKVKKLVAEYGCARALFSCAENERNVLHAAIDEMQAEIDRLSKDAARYRWLRNESWAGYNCSKRKPQVAQTVVFVKDGCGNVKTILAEEALDAAIDEALQPEPQARGEAAMAELRKEAQERGDYGRGDKT